MLLLLLPPPPVSAVKIQTSSLIRSHQWQQSSCDVSSVVVLRWAGARDQTTTPPEPSSGCDRPATPTADQGRWGETVTPLVGRNNCRVQECGGGNRNTPVWLCVCGGAGCWHSSSAIALGVNFQVAEGQRSQNYKPILLGGFCVCLFFLCMWFFFLLLPPPDGCVGPECFSSPVV